MSDIKEEFKSILGKTLGITKKYSVKGECTQIKTFTYEATSAEDAEDMFRNGVDPIDEDFWESNNEITVEEL